MKLAIKPEYLGTIWIEKNTKTEFNTSLISEEFYFYLFKNNFSFLFEEVVEFKPKSRGKK